MESPRRGLSEVVLFESGGDSGLSADSGESDDLLLGGLRRPILQRCTMYNTTPVTYVYYIARPKLVAAQAQYQREDHIDHFKGKIQVEQCSTTLNGPTCSWNIDT